jgi:hypothetical protein
VKASAPLVATGIHCWCRSRIAVLRSRRCIKFRLLNISRFRVFEGMLRLEDRSVRQQRSRVTLRPETDNEQICTSDHDDHPNVANAGVAHAGQAISQELYGGCDQCHESSKLRSRNAQPKPPPCWVPPD